MLRPRTVQHPMTEDDEAWQRRIRDLYVDIEDLYEHVDVTIVMFNRALENAGAPSARGPVDPALAGMLRETAQRSIDTGLPERDVALDPTGRRRAHCYPLRDDDSIQGVVCVVEDDGARRELFVRCAMALFDGYRQNEVALLASEREAREEAQLANRMRDQFLATCAHELRAPIAAIQLWEQVLRSDDTDVATRHRALDAIRESVSSQALLVSDLLDVSRAINGKLHLDRVACSVSDLLTSAIDSVRSIARGRTLDLVVDVEPALGDVLGDPRRLRQVFDNLLSNAIKCTSHGTITVRARRDSESIVVEVCDTGRGIEPDLLPQIFEAFKQGNDASRDGLGLGLAVARQLVELHAGSISATSAGTGRGATFTVRLPLVRGPSISAPSAQPRSPLAGIRVLVVDDDVRLSGALQVVLGQMGAVVAVASSAALGYQTLEGGRIDIVLSDIAMPDEDGYQFARRIRGTRGPIQTLPLVAVTALVSSEECERAFAAGFDRCLGKPIDVSLLVANISQLIETPPDRTRDLR